VTDPYGRILGFLDRMAVIVTEFYFFGEFIAETSDNTSPFPPTNVANKTNFNSWQCYYSQLAEGVMNCRNVFVFGLFRLYGIGYYCDTCMINSVRIACAPAKIRIEHLPNTSLELALDQ
jgi:hypothetical protein